ncbi:MAG: ABC transporter permease [Nitrospirota bacterium]
MIVALVLRRAAWGIGVLWLVATITFVLLRVAPGGPFDSEKQLPPEILANVEAKYHLDEPLWRQYARYIGGLVRGDLGPSFKYLGRDVATILIETFPVSCALGVVALGIALLVGLAFGIAAGSRADGCVDRGGMLLATAGVALPNFVLGVALVLVVSHRLHWLPPALWEGPRYVLLPALTLGLGPAAYIARLTRASLLDVARQDYVRTAYAKGLSHRAVLFTHQLPNALLPVVAIVGPLTAALITGSFVVEYLFAIPGMGRFFITAVTNRDYPLIMGATLLYAALLVIANLVTDVAASRLDPRIRLE